MLGRGLQKPAYRRFPDWEQERLPPLPRPEWTLVAGVSALLVTVDVPTVTAVVRRRQEGEFLGDAVLGHIQPVARVVTVTGTIGHTGAGYSIREVHAVADTVIDVSGAADDADGDVRHVIVRPPSVGKTRRIAGKPAQSLLIFRRRRLGPEIEAEQLRARRPTVPSVQGLAGILQQQLHQILARRLWDRQPEDEVERRGDRRISVEVLELRLVFRRRGVPLILRWRVDDELVDQRVGESRDLNGVTAPAGRLVEAYIPMTGYAVLGAGLPSLVIRVIGTSIAIVWTLVPLNRFTPKGLESSLASSFLLSTGGNRRRLTVSNTAPRSMANVSARCPANTLAPVAWSE